MAQEKDKRRNWDFHLDVPGKGNLEDPLGYKWSMDDGNGAKSKSRTANQEELLKKKAWETAATPIQSLGMNLFMLWMSGSSPGIFSVMLLGYCMTSIVSQFSRINTVFLRFKGIDTTMQKMAYFALCTVSLAYLLWHMSGMGLLPTSSGDWIALIPSKSVYEISAGYQKG
uniref:ER membrane protein complex subunit 4 n=1 Tax=Noctiluca scintillans TaxID=2966 RepID=A0A7S1FL57_NOCSC|mmetsp:Transcript_9920/g.27696  ORF Transcript_9920/g.27696 Transcript_9920/m.27696 type:complete len:170 (+) Transcript_9920:51-560(+)|eukprot:CAMPEP_0194480930 /NCGR_PEP_ID=MMETSP0253-20130528/3573_1 /TAXON_ID=2966 /ORGANISM="Noctiluca scintillans" /LENGTH=169 /DNA_ID=CAMNT_0039320373 /DNA_START=17 /DNA_END=526 /DNA_ORIENTATION=-